MWPLVNIIFIFCVFSFFFFPVSCCLRYTPNLPPCKRILRYSVQTIGASCDINAIVWVHPVQFHVSHHHGRNDRSSEVQLCDNGLCVSETLTLCPVLQLPPEEEEQVCLCRPQIHADSPKAGLFTVSCSQSFCFPTCVCVLWHVLVHSFISFALVLGLNSDGNSSCPCFVLWRKEETQADSDGTRPIQRTQRWLVALWGSAGGCGSAALQPP